MYLQESMLKKSKMSTPPPPLTIGSAIDQLIGSTKPVEPKVDPVEDRNALMKAVSFFQHHPSILTTGVPLVFVAYVSLPVLMALFAWLPWLWAGYSMYSKIPPGTGIALWSAIQAWKAVR